MTTVVYKDGMIAADRLMTANGVFIQETRKILSCDLDGKQLVVSGSGCWVTVLKVWAHILKYEFVGVKNLRVKDESFEVLVYKEGLGLYRLDAVLHKEKLDMRRSYTLGSGFEIAIGALGMGATAVQACKVACKYDTRSGGGVNSVRLRGWNGKGKR